MTEVCHCNWSHTFKSSPKMLCCISKMLALIPQDLFCFKDRTS